MAYLNYTSLFRIKEYFLKVGHKMTYRDIVLIRSGGDISSGIIERLYKCGFKVVILETGNPSSIRREVSFGEAVYSIEEMEKILENNEIPVLIDEKGRYISILKPFILIDAILAKKNLGTHINMAPITIGVGPGFFAGKDVHAVIETKRGHHLGEVIYNGEAIKNSGIPGNIGGFTKERVIHSEWEGNIRNISKIGDTVRKGETIALINGNKVLATIDGILRGIIRDGYFVTKGFKIADIDPRMNEYENCFTISDKARSVGGGALEAILTLKNQISGGLTWMK